MKKLGLLVLWLTQAWGWSCLEPTVLPMTDVGFFHLTANPSGEVAAVCIANGDFESDLYVFHNGFEGDWEQRLHLGSLQESISSAQCGLDPNGLVRLCLEKRKGERQMAWEMSAGSWEFQTIFDPQLVGLDSCLNLPGKMLFFEHKETHYPFSFGLTCSLRSLDIRGKWGETRVVYQQAQKNPFSMTDRRIRLLLDSQGEIQLIWVASIPGDGSKLKLWRAYVKEGDWQSEVIGEIEEQTLPFFQGALGPRDEKAFFWVNQKKEIQALFNDGKIQRSLLGKVSQGSLSRPIFDEKGNLLLLWHTVDKQGVHGICAIYRPANGSWQKPFVIKTFPREVSCSSIALERTPQGKLFLLWEEQKQDMSSIHGGIYLPQTGKLLDQKRVSSSSVSGTSAQLCYTSMTEGMIAWKEQNRVMVSKISFE